MVRVESLKERVMSIKPEISAERAKIITEAYMEHEGKPYAIIRAKALEKILNEMSIYINEGELIVGNLASKPRGACVYPEFSYDWILDEMDTFQSRSSDQFIISEDAKKTLLRVLPYWKDKTTKDKALKIIPQDAINAHKELIYILTALGSGLGHIAVNYEKVIKMGLSTIKSEAMSKISSLDMTEPESIEKRVFYESIIIVCDAVVNFAARFAQLAMKMVEEEKNEERKKELQHIAEVCSNVPERPARSFYEAVQSFWFIQLTLQIESNGHSISPGRFDQYMYEFYKNDTEKGIMDQEKAKEILGCLWVKFNEINKVRDRIGSLAFGGYPMFQNLIVGGVDKYGNDSTNDLSYLCIEVTKQLKLPQPSLSVRISSKSSRSFIKAACELSKMGTGLPAFFNDDVIILILTANGHTIEDARNYAEVGCVEPQCPGKTEGLYSGGFLNLCKVLEITLNNGNNPLTGNSLGLATGDEFSTFKEFYAAFKQQLDHFIRLQGIADNCIDTVHGQYVPTPLVSCFVDDCLEKGLDVRRGGAKYNYTSPNAVGLANVADSLAVIKKVVFDEGKLTLQQLRQVLNKNFEGFEDLQQYFLNGIPKYGNDNVYVDELAKIVAYDYCEEFKKLKNVRGGIFQPGLQSISAHALFVGALGATPDGRKMEELVSDGGISAAQGRDRNGPTALIKSAAHLDHLAATNGALLNIKFHPSAIEGGKGTDNMIAVIKTIFDLNAQHIQFNVVSSDTLKDAQKHPEKYEDLVVRVAGFSVYFTSIDKVLQQDIIERTEQMIS